MDYVFILVFSVAVSFGALALWRIDRRAMENLDAETPGGVDIQTEECEAIDIQNAEQKEQMRWSVMVAAMFLLNAAVALFMRGYYKTPHLDVVNMLLLFGVLWPCAWIDRAEFRIPNRILVVGLLCRCVVLIAAVFIYPQEILYILLQSVVAAVALLLVSLLCRVIAARAVGFGDVKLMMLMGFSLGTSRVWSAMICSMVVLFFYSVVLLAAKRADRKTEIPFAPFLLVGTLMSAILTSF